MRWRGFALLLLCCCACGTGKKITGESTNTKVIYIETEKIRTDTVKVEVPREVVKTQLPYLDTLVMSTSVAVAWAAVDTNGWMLRGELRNKATELKKEIQVVEKVVMKDSIVYQERVVEVPVERVVAQTPAWAKKLLGFNFLLLVVAFVIIYSKFRAKL